VTLRVERIISVMALESLRPEWEGLDADLSPRLPFRSPLWNTFWCEHLREHRALVRDSLCVHAVRDAGGKLIAVAPMVVTHRPSMGPFQVRVLQFLGLDPNITELRGLVCRPEDDGAVFDALYRHFVSRDGDWDWLRWGGVRQGGAIEQGLSAAGALKQTEIPVLTLPLPSTWDEFKGKLSRNIKESLRKCYNSLKRDGHEFVFRAVERPDEARPAIMLFFKLHAKRSHEAGTIVHNDVFRAPRAKAFLLDYAVAMAERGLLRVFQLEIAGVVVATRIGFVFGSELYLYYSGYEPDWGKYSVMTTVVAESIRYAIENGFKLVCLSTGRDVSKTRWSPHEDLFLDYVLVSPRLRGRVAFQAYSEVLRQSEPGKPVGKFLQLARRAW
jgi:CelD/BcsL family acetyltransferase involved in cellulose biosynthesis